MNKKLIKIDRGKSGYIGRTMTGKVVLFVNRQDDLAENEVWEVDILADNDRYIKASLVQKVPPPTATEKELAKVVRDMGDLVLVEYGFRRNLRNSLRTMYDDYCIPMYAYGDEDMTPLSMREHGGQHYCYVLRSKPGTPSAQEYEDWLARVKALEAAQENKAAEEKRLREEAEEARLYFKKAHPAEYEWLGYPEVVGREEELLAKAQNEISEWTERFNEVFFETPLEALAESRRDRVAILNYFRRNADDTEAIQAGSGNYNRFWKYCRDKDLSRLGL